MVDELQLLRRHVDALSPASEAEIDGARHRLYAEIDLERRVAPGHIDLRRARQLGPVRRRRLRLGFAMAALVFAAAAVIIPVLAGRTPHAKVATTRPTSPQGRAVWTLAGYIAQPLWRVRPGTGSDPYRITCPTATTCYATGPSRPPSTGTTSTPPQYVVEVSHDGGGHWQQLLAPAGAPKLIGLHCLSADNCVAIGGTIGFSAMTYSMVTTADGGQSWTTLPIPGTSVGGGLLSCATSSACVATYSVPGPRGQGSEYVAYMTSDGGHDWSASAFPSTFSPDALECSRGGQCIAGGYKATLAQEKSGDLGPAAIVYSTNGGASWTEVTVPSGGSNIDTLSCANANNCMAIETGASKSSVLVSDDGGETWTASPSGMPAGVRLNSVSCPTASDCWVSGSRTIHAARQAVVYSTQDGGASWGNESLPTVGGLTLGVVGAISCPRAPGCFAVANVPSPSSVFGQQVVLSDTAGST